MNSGDELLNYVRENRHRRWRHGNNIVEETQKKINELYTSGGSLNFIQRAELIKIWTSGRTCDSWIQNDSKLLDLITKYTSLSVTSVTQIITKHPVCDAVQALNRFKWVENLKAKKYVFTKGQMSKLIGKGYIDINMLMSTNNDMDKTMNELASANKERFFEYCQKVNAVPNDVCFVKLILLKNFEYSDFEKLINAKYQKSFNTLSIVLEKIEYLPDSTFIKIFDYLFNNNISIDSQLLYKTLYNNENTARDRLIGLTHILVSKGFKPELNNLFDFLFPNGSKPSIQMSESRIKFMDLYFIDLKYKPDAEFCDRAIQSNVLFCYLVGHYNRENIFIITDNSIVNACKCRSSVILKYLLNEKCMPDIRCINAMNEIDKEIFWLLVDNGLGITYDVIIACIRKNGFVIPNLDRYVKIDDNLYFECYYNGLGSTHAYYSYFDEIHKFRQLFCNQSIKQIEKYLNDNPNFKPDQYCYDNAMIENDTHGECIIDWLSNKYQLHPTMMTFMQLSYYNKRKVFFENYILTNKYHSDMDFKHYYITPISINDVRSISENKLASSINVKQIATEIINIPNVQKKVVVPESDDSDNTDDGDDSDDDDSSDDTSKKKKTITLPKKVQPILQKKIIIKKK